MERHCEEASFLEFVISCGVWLLQADKIATLVKAANVSMEGFWPSLFAKLCEKRSVDDLITNIGSGKWKLEVANLDIRIILFPLIIRPILTSR